MLKPPIIAAALISAAALLLGVARADPGVPALQVMAPNGAKSLLIGTLHAAAAGLRQPAATVLDGAKRYVVEGLPGKGVRPDIAPEVLAGQTKRAGWAGFLTPAQMAELHRRAVCVESAEGFPPSTLGKVVNLSLTYSSARSLSGIAIYRCAPEGLHSSDWLIAQAAKARGLEPTPLESPAEVEVQRKAVPEQIYVALLYDALRPEGDTVVGRTVEALNVGDYEAVNEIVSSTARTPEQAQTYYDIMVAQRNRIWMPRLAALVDDGDAVVVVGADHLAGPQGLVALLEAQGYRVMPTQIPAAP